MSIQTRLDFVQPDVMIPEKQFNSKDLNEFLDLKEEQIMKTGIPPRVHTFLENMYKLISIKGSNSPSIAASNAQKILYDFQTDRFWTSSDSQFQEICHLVIESYLVLGGESVISVVKPFNFECLGQIHQKILTCIASKRAKDLGIQDHKFVIVPNEGSKSKGFTYFKCHETWFVSPCSHSIKGEDIESINMTQLLIKPLVDPSHGGQRKFIPMAGQCMFVEKDLSLVSDDRVLINVTMFHSDPRSKNFDFKTQDFKSFPKEKLPSLVVTITYYTGLPEYDTLKPNCICFEMIIDSKTFEPSLDLRLATPNPHLVSMVGIETDVIDRLKIKAEELVKDFKQEWVEQFFSPENRVQYVISYPKTDLEKKKALLEILLGLSTDSEKNADLIEYLFLELEPAVTLEEFKDIATPSEYEKLEEGELEPTPQLMNKILLKEAMNEYKAARLLAPPESNNNVIASTSAPAIKEEVLQKEKAVQAQMLSKIPKKGKKFSKNKKNFPAKETATTTAPNPPVQFKLAPDEKEKVKSVMQGNPMRSKDFNKFFTKLLKRKMGESKQSVKKDGSHVKLHMEKPDGGSTGHTLVRAHGKKDTVGFIGSQKRSLKDLFNN